MKIPKTIISYWHDSTAIPPEVQNAIDQTKAAHPGYSHILLDDISGLELAHATLPCFADYIEKNRIPASKSDIVRLLALYEYGGFYIDSSMAFSQSLAEQIPPESELLLVKRDDSPDLQKNPKKVGVINGIMGSVAGSDFLLACLKKVFFNLHTGIHNYVVHVATGPISINEVLRDMKATEGIAFLSIHALQNTCLKHHRVAGVNNSWVEKQFHGIMDPDYYKDAEMVETIWNEFGPASRSGQGR